MDELNELPQGWKWVRLGDVTKQDRLIVEPYSELSNNLPYLGLEHIESNSGKILKDIQGKIEDEGKSTTFYFNENHILYGKLRPYLNKVALPNFEGRCTTELMPFLPKDNINREFIAWILKRDETISFVMQEATGSRMPRADIDKLLNLIIPLPPFPEQQRLATLLTAKLALIEQAKEKITAQLQAAQALTAAYLREVFESEEAKGWEWVKLGELTDLSRGYNPPKSTFSYEKKEGYVRFYQIRDGSSDTYSVYVPNTKQLHKMKDDDIMMVAYRHIGRVFRGVSGAFNVALCKISNLSNDTLNDDYLFHILSSKYVKGELLKYSERSLIPSMSVNHLSEIKIPLPPILKQKEIANYLSEKLATVEQLKTTLQTQLDSINQLPAALLKQAFKGEL